MKKIVFAILTSCVLFQYGHAQKFQDSLRKLNDYDLGTYYLKKSKEQKTIGWILLGVGITSTIVGGQQASKDIFNESSGEAWTIVGALCTVASIPVFLSGAKNKGRAEILLRNQNIPLTHVSGTRLTSIGIAIPLRK